MTATTRRALLITAAAIAASPAAAHDYTAGDITIGHPWTRAAGANGTGVGYMRLHNTGALPDRLVGASSPIARATEIHTRAREGDVMRMRPVRDIPIPPGAAVELRPGGLHVMLIGLAAPLVQGGRAPLILRFERAGEVRVELAVEAAGARTGGHGH